MFSTALVLSIVLTLLLKRLGLRFGAVDLPDEKIHTGSVAGYGGGIVRFSFKNRLSY